jgi:DNA-binding transcriptional LysR family regulator
LAHPTVWLQVRALEKEFGEPLLERHARGSRLTEAGNLLAELVGPVVASLTTLKQRYREARALHAAHVVVATTPRILLEHLPECVTEFRSRHPDVPLTLKEMFEDQVHAQVEAGSAELGLVASRAPNLLDPFSASRWLEFEPLYELDVVLITPKDHPLARKRQVTLGDLGRYPLVNAPHGMPDPVSVAVLQKANLLDRKPHLVEPYFVSTACRYVELGFGIGIVPVLPGHEASPLLHTRVMNRYFGSATVYAVRRKGALATQASTAFTAIVKARLQRRPRLPPR